MNKKEYELSIIIVSFNAVDFLKLTLDSVKQAIQSINAEVLLVDNSNNTALQKVVTLQYPFVSIINNNQNLGFAKANNKALKVAKGKYALLLNPDTIVSEDTFIKIINYYKQNPATGGLGVKMIDGSGRYLKESKRGFPSLRTSFYKLAWIHKLFPQSNKVAKYYEGHLDENAKQKVDILSGAFLVIPRDHNHKFTFLDEQYFMYGEDIDLSYRLKQEFGFNIYFPEVTIIHFKGQSTIKNKQIIKHFYRSMWIFYKQHLMSKRSAFTNVLVKSGINLFMISQQILSSTKRLTNKPLKIQPQSGILISNNSEVQSKIEQYLKISIQLLETDNLPTENQLVIFDPNYISYKKIINIVLRGYGHFGFLTKDHYSLVLCTCPSKKGHVIHLQ